MHDHRSKLRVWLARAAQIGGDDRAGGIGLGVATVVALVWANWPGSHGYRRAWEAIAPGSGLIGVHLTWQDVVDDTLMVAFFVMVGLEIRREVISGELRTARRAATPVLAALAGMALPAAIFAVVVHGGPGAHAWGVPIATDVAFAVGALALVAGAAAPRYRVFLLTLAVADDIGSILVLVFAYSRDLHPLPLVGGVVLLGLLGALAATGLLRWWVHLPVALGAWLALVHAGVEPAVVGVVVGLCLPSEHAGTPGAHGTDPSTWEQRLGPWVNLGVLPLFALANVGLQFVGSGLGTSSALTILVAVVVARVVGKTAGIPLAAAAVTRAGGDRYGDQRLGRDRFGVGGLASIGFTVPLLVIRQALPVGSPAAAGATAGLLVSTVLGLAVGAALLRPQRVSC